jgi:hypothetical protein
MREAKLRDGVREFNADDARVIARRIIESDAGRVCRWTPAAVETIAALIVWEVRHEDFAVAFKSMNTRRNGILRALSQAGKVVDRRQ